MKIDKVLVLWKWILKRVNFNSCFFLQVKRYDVASYAEKNGPFIFEFISQVFGENPIYDVSNTQNTNIPNNYQNGLYIFFIEHGMRKYPIYVGMTSRTFRQRFMEHLNAKVIHYYNQNNPGFPENIPFQARSHYPLKVICVQSSPVIAKFVESALLDHFDFCLNVVENNNIRVNINLSHQFAIHQSRQSFHITFENVNSRYQNWYLNG